MDKCPWCDPNEKARMAAWIDRALNERRPDRYRVSDPLTKDFETPPTDGIPDDGWMNEVTAQVAERFPMCEECIQLARVEAIGREIENRVNPN